MPWMMLIVNYCLWAQVAGGGLTFPSDGSAALPPTSSTDSSPGVAHTEGRIESSLGASPATGSSATGALPPRALEPVTPRKAGPADMLGALLTAPDGKPLAGRELTLTEVLAATTDRNRQLEATQTYWALSVALAEYYATVREQQMLEQLLPLPATRGSQDALLNLETRLESARAAVEEAKLKLLSAQYAMADKVRLTGSELPLPADAPHTGTYITNYDKIFEKQSAPPALRLIYRSLPLELDAVESHTKALLAAQDAADSALELFGTNQADWSTLMSCYERCLREREGFLAAVLRYNKDIAAYAISVAPLDRQGPTLAELLIKAPTTPARTTAAAETPVASPTEGLTRATFEAPLATPPAQTVPAQAAPARMAPARQEPTLAPPRDKSRAAKTAAPPATTTPPTPPTGGAAPPADDHFDAFGGRSARRLALGQAGLYQALQDMSAPRRSQELAEALHWDQQEPTEGVKSVTLDEVLVSLPWESRRQAIAAYWQARESAARCQVLARQLEQLDALAPIALDQRTQPGGSEAMLRLEAARSTVAAELLDAKVRMHADEYALARAAGSPSQIDGLHPTTLPHGGRYDLLPQATSTAARWHTTLPTLQTALQQRALAVVACDADRAARTTALDSGTGSIDGTIAAIARQTAETQDFLALLTDYNREIANYALAVLPSGTGPAKLVTSLVLDRERGP